MDRGIEDIETGDRGVSQVMSVEELRFGLSSIGSLSIPPAGPVAIQRISSSTSHGNTCTRNRDERTTPLFITKRCLALEDETGAIVQIRHVKSGAGGNDDAIENDGRTARL